jgi:SH3-like domain-containing protein
MATTRQSAGLLWHLSAVAAALALSLVAAASSACASDIALGRGSVTGLPIPRFVSLKADRINVRVGPSRDQDVRWVYTRAGMPVEITAEFDNWRRIRDWQGGEGWVYHSLLSGTRTALVVPTLKNDLVPLYESPDTNSRVVARLQAGVLGRLVSCTGTWCEFSGKGFDGWIQQVRLWGAYPSEKVD